ncbi:hypothetical protein GCM10008171_17910 [Methylopila jiangsuensis]|jgi:cytochrome c553|uniref:Cytochrome c domain-containing protein n=1 Tax=Methylopila jiangsuensis TaxID=586230 RepID=A0A9W6JGB5_9HYPH|nr:hypothetical protein GCM10008171_17910 [Methylopila jiangsuensis]
MRVHLAKLAGGTLCLALLWIRPASAAELASEPSLGEVVASRCAACHAAGSSDARILDGRPKADLAAALRGFRERPEPRSVMGSRTRLMTDAEIDAVAAYFAGRTAVERGRE